MGGRRRKASTGQGATHPLGISRASHPVTWRGFGTLPTTPPCRSLTMIPSNPDETANVAWVAISANTSSAPRSWGYNRNEIDPASNGAIVVSLPDPVRGEVDQLVEPDRVGAASGQQHQRFAPTRLFVELIPPRHRHPHRTDR